MDGVDHFPAVLVAVLGEGDLGRDCFTGLIGGAVRVALGGNALLLAAAQFAGDALVELAALIG